MATKSVIEIELIDEQFKAFSAQLKAMQAIVAGMPDQWRNIAKEVQNEQKAESKAANEAEKARKKRLQEEKDFNKIIEDRKKAFMDAAYFTGNIAKNLASGALSIAKWTAFAAIGGGFGLGGLAASASDYRKRSQGLGTTTAGLRAAETNLGQYVDVNSVLGNITNLQHDITQQYKLTRLGGGKGDSAAQLQTVMTKAIQDFKAHGQDLNYARAVGLTDIFSPEDLIRLAKLSAEELADTFKKMSQDLKRFEIDDSVSRKWQEFWQQLGRAGQDIQVILIDKLQSLVKPLTELSQTIINLISDFLNTHDVAKLIEGFGEKIKTFVNYLDSDDFKTSVTEFFEALKAIGKATINAAKFLGLIDKPKEEKATIPQRITMQLALAVSKHVSDLNVLGGNIRKYINEPVSSWWKGVMDRPFIRDGRTISERNNNPGNLKFIGQAGATLGENGFAKFNTVQDGFKALQNQLQLYGSGQSKAAGYKKLDTIEGIMKIYAPSNENDTEAYIKNLEKLTGHSRKESLDFSDTQTVSAMMAGISKVETGKNLYNPTQVQLLITNTTDTNVAVKGLTNK